jgi:hypothetical protein
MNKNHFNPRLQKGWGERRMEKKRGCRERGAKKKERRKAGRNQTDCSEIYFSSEVRTAEREVMYLF